MAVLAAHLLGLAILLIHASQRQTGAEISVGYHGDWLSDSATPLKVKARELNPGNTAVATLPADPAKSGVMAARTSPAAAATVEPVAEAQRTPDAQGTVHVVKAGDTLYKLARDYRTTVKDLRLANGLTGDRLAVGSRLKIVRGV